MQQGLVAKYSLLLPGFCWVPGYLPCTGHPNSSRPPCVQLTVSSEAVSVPKALAEKKS